MTVLEIGNSWGMVLAAGLVCIILAGSLRKCCCLSHVDAMGASDSDEESAATGSEEEGARSDRG